MSLSARCRAESGSISVPSGSSTSGSDSVGVGQCGDGLVVADPLPVAGDADRDQLVLGPIGRREHVRRRDAGHVVFCGGTTEQHNETDAVG